jgi:DNA-binding MarR family transcriptional regulator
MPEQLPPEVADEPPAARLVYLALEGSVLDQHDLADRTGLTTRRIREVASTLDEKDMIASYRHPSDARRNIYFDPEAFDAIEAHQRYTSSQ